MKYLLDTNILTRLSTLTSPDHAVVAQAIQILTRQGHTLHVVPQTLYEFWAVASRPQDVNGLAPTTSDVRREVDAYQQTFDFLPDTSAIYDEWLDLVTTHGVSGRPTHDARLVAACRIHELDTVLTRNPTDFKRFDIRAVHPADIV